MHPAGRGATGAAFGAAFGAAVGAGAGVWAWAARLVASSSRPRKLRRALGGMESLLVDGEKGLNPTQGRARMSWSDRRRGKWFRKWGARGNAELLRMSDVEYRATSVADIRHTTFDIRSYFCSRT